MAPSCLQWWHCLNGWKHSDDVVSTAGVEINSPTLFCLPWVWLQFLSPALLHIYTKPLFSFYGSDIHLGSVVLRIQYGKPSVAIWPAGGEYRTSTCSLWNLNHTLGFTLWKAQDDTSASTGSHLSRVHATQRRMGVPGLGISWHISWFSYSLVLKRGCVISS